LNNLLAMTKAELETKPLSDLHALAADAGVEKFRMLTKGELAERLADSAGGSSDGGSAGGSRSGGRSRSGSGSRSRSAGRSGSSSGTASTSGRGGANAAKDDDEDSERPPRRRRRRRRPDGGPDEDPSEREAEGEAPTRDRQREDAGKRQREDSGDRDEGGSEGSAPSPAGEADSSESARPRRRRRRRFGRRGKGEVTLQGLLLPPEPGRQAILYGETREACTALLRAVAADIAADAKGPDPVALLIDPSPEELADWRREAPQAEIVAAGQPRHAADALAQAARRAGSGEDVFLLIDSLTRLAEASGDAEAAKEFFDAGREQAGAGGGSLTVVAALEKPAA
jgi:transcription termination factor Rho